MQYTQNQYLYDYVHGNKDKVNVQILNDNYSIKRRFCPNYRMNSTDFHRFTRSSYHKYSTVNTYTKCFLREYHPCHVDCCGHPQ